MHKSNRNTREQKVILTYLLSDMMLAFPMSNRLMSPQDIINHRILDGWMSVGEEEKTDENW